MSFRIDVAYLASVVLTAVPPGPLWSQPSAARKLVDSDAVVVAEVISGRQTGKAANCVLLINRTLKGSLLPNDRVNVSWNSWLGFDQDLTGKYGMWHLNQLPSGAWVLRQVDRGVPYVPMPKGTSPLGIMVPAGIPALPQPATVGDRMAAELAAALQGYSKPSDVRELASRFLALDKTPFVSGLYRVLRASPDPELRLTGLTGMLRLNDLTALTDLANSVDQIPKVQVRHWVLSAIMARHEVSPAVIQTLGRIASSPDLDTQFAAADALGEIHTRDTLPILAQLLDSPRQMTREAAMRGLGWFVDNLPISTEYNVWNGRANIPQGPAPYRTADTDRYSLSHRPPGNANDAEYVQFWKSWWAKMKTELTKP